MQVQVKKSIISTAISLLLIVTAYLSMVQTTQAATMVSGVISTNTVWTLAQSPYQATADISIENGATLTIEPGVVVTFDTAINLTLANGALVARGTAGQPITFTSSLDQAGSTPAAGDWGSLKFLNGTNDTTTVIEHAEIRYGQGITVQSASPTFNYLKLSNNLGAAISIDLASSPKGVGNQATGNTLNGVSVPAGDVLGTVTWGIKGIPYVVEAGVVSVGASPNITGISPLEVQQGLSVDAVITGTRLAGTDTIKFDTSGISAIFLGGGSDTSIPVRITASTTQPLGNVPFDIKTSAGWVRYANGVKVIPLKPSIAVNNISPTSMRRSESKGFQISGSSLLGAQVTTPSGGGLTLSGLLSTDTTASFSLTAAATATLGTQTLSISNPALANGVAAMLVNIIDALPRINTNTIPSAVIPDGVARPFTLSLTNIDTVDHSFNLSALDPTIIGVTPATVTIPAGTSSVPISIAGLKLGYTMLNITSPTLAAVSKQIYASSLLNGASVGPVLSIPVGVSVPYTLATLLPVGTVVPVASSAVGVDVPYNLNSLLPSGTVVPLTSPAVGVDVPYNLGSLLPNGTVVPVTSQVVGVDVPYSLSTLPPGTAVSPPVGVSVP